MSGILLADELIVVAHSFLWLLLSGGTPRGVSAAKISNISNLRFPQTAKYSFQVSCGQNILSKGVMVLM